jgi:hypothetical protein
LEWFKAYYRALTFNIPEVQGLLAIKAFLDAVGVKLRLEWARVKLSEVLEKAELGEPVPDLGIIGRLFAIQVNESGKKHRVYVILRARLDDNNTSSEKAGYECPCLLKSRRHRWSLDTCSFLELAVIGKTDRKLRRILPKA